jgi:hypothetical protein
MIPVKASPVKWTQGKSSTMHHDAQQPGALGGLA